MFKESKCSTEKKLANFTKYVRRQNLARFMVQYELFKKQMGKGRNYYTIGCEQGMTQMADYSKNVLMGMGSDNKKKYYLQHVQLMKETLLDRRGDIDAIDWLLIGKHYSKNGEEEVAF